MLFQRIEQTYDRDFVGKNNLESFEVEKADG